MNTLLSDVILIPVMIPVIPKTPVVSSETKPSRIFLSKYALERILLCCKTKANYKILMLNPEFARFYALCLKNFVYI